MSNLHLPSLDPESEEHGRKVVDFIKNEIKSSHGKITFNRFMELSLYAPGLGYYSAGLRKFGAQGDFVTAPEISNLFARCLANQCAQVFTQIANPDILEFGAGTGILAADLLTALSSQNLLPKHYYIVEISADLKQRQQTLLKQKCPEYFKNIHWLDQLPDKDFEGVVIANEVVDAMPVHRFHLAENRIQEYYVAMENNDFNWYLDQASSPELLFALQQIQQNYLAKVKTYNSEINLLLPAWINSIAEFLRRGIVLIIDYGFPGQEYYLPQRNEGTLMCHFRQRAHSNPLMIPGLQDITAHVNFTALAKAAQQAGLDVAGYVSQAHFLLNCGLTDLINVSDAAQQVEINTQVKLLTLPSEMGELFKVLALTRELFIDLIGFQHFDRRYNL